MRIIVSGGGTSGHIYPAISVAKAIKTMRPETEIEYVGLPHSTEASIASREGIPFHPIESKPLSLRPSMETVRSLLAFRRGYLRSRELIQTLQPDAVIATGGYVCGPIGLAAAKMHVPLYIHESNAHPGMTSRFLDRYAAITFYSYAACLDKLRGKGEKIHVGTPIRPEFRRVPKNQEQSPFTVLSFGGSGGQATLNIAVSEIFQKHRDLPLCWRHIMGLQGKEKMFEDLPAYAEVVGYTHEMYAWMCTSDLVIAGCGAQTLAEIAAMGKASILIPKADAKENHQFHNAMAFVQDGAAEMIEERDLDARRLLETVLSFQRHPERCELFAERIAAFSAPHAARDMASIILTHLEVNHAS